MGREIIQNSIIDKLETILSLVANINSKSGIIPQIDIDLLQEHIRKLYQDVQYLDDENQKWKNEPRKIRDESIRNRPENLPQREESEPPVIKNEKPEIKESETPIIENTIETVEEEVISNEEPFTEEEPVLTTEEPIKEIAEEITEEPEEIIEEPKAEEIIESVEEEKEIIEPAEEPKAEKEPALFDEPMSVADHFSKEEKSINDKMSEGTEKNAVHQNAQKTPVSNLKTAIGINDKFMFVNELFQGDMKSYDIFIREINDMNNGNAAINAYGTKLEQLGANAESSAAKKLGDYIERRFL
ncbi:MAG: hypothetical protein JXR53_01125 [Bacteroidales bacterium]|nr:hypothetical protein [Bacteroidales bacterium]